VNCNLKAALKIFHHASQETWDDDLLWLSLSFNTAVHESHKSMSNKLFLGRVLKCPLQVRWNLTPEDDGGMAVEHQSFWEEAYKNLISAKKKVAHRYNLYR
jgi:hypothetical protein